MHGKGCALDESRGSLVILSINSKLWLLHLQAVLHRSDKAGFTWSSRASPVKIE